MANFYDAEVNELIKQVAEELKKLPEIKAPDWAQLVKTGAHKERAPDNAEWWHIRAASVLRKVAILGPIGVNKLRTKYGGRKKRGSKPEHFVKGSGSIARKILQQLEKAGLIKKVEKGKPGRIIAPKGTSILDKAAIKLSKTREKIKITSPKPIAKPEAPKMPKPVVAKPIQPAAQKPAQTAPAEIKPQATKPAQAIVPKTETMPMVEEKK